MKNIMAVLALFVIATSAQALTLCDSEVNCFTVTPDKTIILHTKAGHEYPDQINLAMTNYQWSKTNARNTEGTDDYYLWRANMAYWETRLIAARALALEAAGPPPFFGATFGGDYLRRLVATNKDAFNLEVTYGFPLFPLVYP